MTIIDLFTRAAAVLLDPEQTAVAPAVAGPLSALLTDLVRSDLANDTNLDYTKGARETVLAILDHEHTRLTTPPENGDQP